MKKTLRFFMASLLLLTFIIGCQPKKEEKKEFTKDVIPKKIIVELDY